MKICQLNQVDKMAVSQGFEPRTIQSAAVHIEVNQRFTKSNGAEKCPKVPRFCPKIAPKINRPISTIQKNEIPYSINFYAETLHQRNAVSLGSCA